MADQPVLELLPRPGVGRLYTGRRLARFGDLSPGGRLRLDAVARYLQDVSSDDTTDSGLDDDLAWVVRRLVIEVHENARFREDLEMTTWCSGTGSRWAERRVSIEGDRGARIEAGILWVHVDFDTGQPKKLADDFFDLYGESAAGRRVGVRLQHAPKVPAEASRRQWPHRFTDFDMLNHVNNTAYWAAVEEALSSRGGLRPPYRAEIEYRTAIERDDVVELVTDDRPDGSLALWLVSPGSTDDGSTVYATAEVTGRE
jgi:acyl-ACP thioesterase